MKKPESEFLTVEELNNLLDLYAKDNMRLRASNKRLRELVESLLAANRSN